MSRFTLSDYLNPSHVSIVELLRMLEKRGKKFGEYTKVTFPFLDDCRNVLREQYLSRPLNNSFYKLTNYKYRFNWEKHLINRSI